MREVALIAAALGLGVLLAGCAGGGPPASTEVPAPGVAAPSAPLPAAATAAPASPAKEATMAPFVLTSTAFGAGRSIPRRHACDGADVSPSLAWTGVPAGTGALVLLVDDPDARGWVHWLVLDLPGTDGSLPEALDPGADPPAQGRNDFGRRGWGGPCPPSGTHRYAFTLYALVEPLSLGDTPDGTAVRKALDRATVVGKAVLEGTYRRGG